VSAPELWSLEEQFWKGDVRFYEQHLDAECVMVFPPPARILTREPILQSLSAAPRWREVTFRDQLVLMTNESTALLVYSASAVRESEKPYTTLASRLYRRQGGQWKLLFHQQTPG